MAHRKHQPSHVLFTRPCEWCGEPFDYCGSCQPGRLYGDEACSNAAREESTRAARAKYNDRESEEGREAHRLEEATRRERLAQKRVGDLRIQVQADGLLMPSSAAHQAAAEASNDTLMAPADPAILGAPEPCATHVEPPPDGPRPPPTEPAEWTLVACPGLLDAAQRRLGTEAQCPFCGRHGRIVRVVSLDHWRRRHRYGIE